MPWLVILLVLAACGPVEDEVTPESSSTTAPSAYPAPATSAPPASYPGPTSPQPDAYPGPGADLPPSGQGSLTLTPGLQELEGQLLYQSDQTGSYQIYLQVDDQEPVALAGELPLSVEGVWSPDGEKIAFVSHGTDETNLVIQLMNADGSDKRWLTPVQPRLNWRPAWSPDGRELLFLSNRDGNFEIYRVNADGSDLVNITNDQANDLDPDWSGGTGKIVFISNRDGGNGIYTMNGDGSEVTNLLGGEWGASYPRWSPDGRQIAFASEMAEGVEIFVMNADGSNVRQVTDRVGDNVMPAWVNDDRLLFSGDFGDETWDLYIINVDGTNMIQLTSQGLAQTYSERYPRWRP